MAGARDEMNSLEAGADGGLHGLVASFRRRFGTVGKPTACSGPVASCRTRE
jgi:hypothetical protein